MKKLRNIFFILLSSVIISSSISNYFEITKNLEIFNNIYREINTYYVDPIDPGELMHSTIDTMLKRLDPYTKYIPESEIEDFRFQTTGDYGGIGATIRKIDNDVVIYEPYKGFPADKSGLVMGDVIIEIDQKKIINSSTEEVSNLLKGSPGTKVMVKVKRNSGEIAVFEITREKIHVPSVPYAGFLNNNTGYIKLTRFTKNCTQEVETALNLLQEEKELSGLILDLRSNPGGLLNESINLANLFIDQNEIVVTTNGKSTDWKKNYTTKKTPKYKALPLVVLVNGASASASEIVAGAIQDLDRGIIIGNTTYGKGLVQQSRKLSYNSRLKVTVAKYYTPSGRCIQDIGKTREYNSYLNNTKNEEDSLRNTFFTRNGRTVYDGGGIDPDLKIEPIEYPDVLIALITNNYIYKYGNRIFDELPQYNSVDEFTINDSLYTDFVQYIRSENFEFNIYSDDILALLESSINELKSEEVHTAELDTAILNLKESIASNKFDDLLEHSVIIKEYLCANLITRSFYQEGKIEYSLIGDPYVEKALSILKDKEKYQQILSP